MNLSDFSTQLKQELTATTEKINQIEDDALSKFETDLQQRCSSAATTLKNGMDGVESEFQNSLTTLNTAVKAWVPQLLKVLKWAVVVPILATFLACSMMVAGTYAWWKLESQERVHMKLWESEKHQKYMIVDEPTWTTCEEQTTTDKRGNKVTTYQACRKAE